MTDHAELNARAARLMGHEPEPYPGTTGVMLCNPSGAPGYRNFAEDLNHFAEVLRTQLDKPDSPAWGLVENLLWTAHVDRDLPAALESLLDAVESDRREGK